MDRSLEALLEESKRIYVGSNGRWITRIYGFDVTVEQRDHDAFATVNTEITVTEENRLSLLAMASHLEGWEFEDGTFCIPEEGKVAIVCSRPVDLIADPDLFASTPARILRLTYLDLNDASYGSRPFGSDFGFVGPDPDSPDDRWPCTPTQWNAREEARFDF